MKAYFVTKLFVFAVTGIVTLPAFFAQGVDLVQINGSLSVGAADTTVKLMLVICLLKSLVFISQARKGFFMLSQQKHAA